MRQLILILVITMLLKPLWPWVQYSLNYQYIIENLCANKSKPELNCNGKCFLANQLAKESKENNQHPLSFKLLKLELPIINWFHEQKMSYPFFGFVSHNYGRYHQLKQYLIITDILQPPELIFTQPI